MGIVATFLATNKDFDSYTETGWGPESNALLVAIADLLVYWDMQPDSSQKDFTVTELERMAGFLGKVIEARGTIALDC